MIALLLDQGLPRRTASDLRVSGWDATHVGELGMGAATDDEILDRAADENRVVVTLDSDFARLLASRRAIGPSVVHIRIERLRREQATLLIPDICTAVARELEEGAVATVTASGTRVRSLPLP